MAEESEEFRRLKEALGMQADLAEEELRIRHGVTAKLDAHGNVEAGTLKALEATGARRGKIEQKINSDLERLLGKEQALQNRKQVLYEKELENYNYFIDDQNNLTKMLSRQNLDLDKEQKKVLDRLRKEGASEERSKAKQAELQKAQDEFGSNFVKGLGDLTKGLGSFAMGLANGNTNFTSLNPLIDIVANSLASLAKAIPFVGEAIAGATKAAAEGAKFVLELMDKNLKAFQELANAGALTAEGMEGVSRQFLESGMSLEGFKKAIRENAGDLAQWGKTVGGGADKFTKAVGMLTKGDGPLAEAGLELRKLGMTADDIGTASAGFLQQELKLGRARNMTEEQLAKGTAKYAQELDALQKVTGLSKEDIIKQRNEQLADSRFSASMDVIAEENAAGAEAIKQFALTIKDPELKRGFMDLTSGANTEAAKKALRVMGDTVPDVIDKLKNSKPEEVAKNFDLAQTMMKKGAKQAIDTFGKETFALMPDTKTLGSYSSLRDIQNQNNVSLEEAIEIQNKQKKAAGDLTENTVQAQQNMERMGQEVFKMGTLALPMASSAVNAFTKSMVDLMKYINKILGKDPNEGLSNNEEDNKALLNQQKVMDENIDAQKELKDAILLLKKAQTDPNKTDKDKAELQKAVDVAKEKAKKTQLEEEEFNKQSQIAMAKKMERQMAMQNELRVINKERRASGQEAYLNTDQAKAGGHKFKAEAEDAPTTRSVSSKAGGPSNEHSSSGGGGGSNIKLSSITSKSGRSAQVNAEYAPQFQKLVDYLDNAGYDIRSLGGYIDRDVRGKAGVKSIHAHGAAIDINPDTNPMGSTLVTDMPAEIADVARGLGLGWGGNWRSSKDAMHFSAAKSEGGSLLKAMDGGIFDGPSSGYDVELHGREAIVPLNNNVSKDPLTSMSMPGVDQLAGITQSMMQMMEDKFDEMISQLSTGNAISDKLLRNTMV
jgi:hypothetical protein